MLPRFAPTLSLLALSALACGDDSATGGSGGGGGSTSTAPPSWDRPVTPPTDADAEANRLSCGYQAGSLPAETQGSSRPNGADIPVDHIIIVMQENRSFDHYFQMLPSAGQPDAEVAPAGYTNPDGLGGDIAPFHGTSYCFVDTNHEWKGSHEQWNDGAMDGYVLTNEGWGTLPPHPLVDSSSGARAMAYYDSTDLPFYYWLATEFSIADHYFSSLLGPTFPNRQYLYAASSRGSTEGNVPAFVDLEGACETDADCGGEAGSCEGGACKGTCTKDDECGRDAPVGTCNAETGVCARVGRTIFHYMDQRKVDFKVYTSGLAGWLLTPEAFTAYQAEHQRTMDDFYADAAAGTLPAVAFVDSHIGDEGYDQDDEHPPASMQVGQAFVAKVTDAVLRSPNWPRSAMFLTYDEHGGLFDHVPPPEACPPGDFAAVVEAGGPPGDFDRYGVRVPMLLVSPYAKKNFVAHRVYDHTSILRFIQARWVLPAITNRDANAEAPWEMFDFEGAPHATAPTVTMPPIDQAKMDECAAVWVP